MPIATPTVLPVGTSPAARFRPQRVRFVQPLLLQETAIKLYGAQGEGSALGPKLMTAVENLVDLELRTRPYREDVNGAGFVVVYQGRSHVHVMIDRWQRENELLHAGFVGAAMAPYNWAASGQGEEVFPDWYLRLVEFERTAWRRHVLDRAADPDFEAYLTERCNGD